MLCLLDDLALIKIPRYSKPDSLGAKGSHLADTFTRNAAFKRNREHLSLCHCPKGHFPK